MYLVIGALGQLGSELRLVLGDKAEYVDREELDITIEAAVRGFADRNRYEAIVNCAAYTAVDKAEEDEAAARRLNADAPKFLAQTGVPLVHISTDYVFDGCNFRPYVETDAPNPQSVYGKTKYDGEQAVLAAAETAVIIRTSWLYSPMAIIS